MKRKEQSQHGVHKSRRCANRYADLSVHPFQDALVKRVCDARQCSGTSFVWNDDPGLGKTRSIGRYMEILEKEIKPHMNILQVFASSNAITMQEHYYEIGLSGPSQLQIAKLPRIAKDVENNHTVRMVCTHKTLKQLIFSDQLIGFARTLPKKTMVVLYVDEVHSIIFNKSSRKLQVEKFRQAIDLIEKDKKHGVRVFVHGASAKMTVPPMSLLEMFFGRNFKCMSMTDEEASKFRIDIVGEQPKPPTSFILVQMESPLQYPKQFVKDFQQLVELILMYLISPEDDCRKKKEIKTNVTKQIDLIVGRLPCLRFGASLFERTAKIEMNMIEGNGNRSSESRMMHPSVLVSCDNKNISESFVNDISELQGSDGILSFDCFDLRSKIQNTSDLNARNNKKDQITQKFVAQNGPVFTIISETQRKSTNEFGKDYHIVVAVDGPCDKPSAKQYLARLGRLPLESGDYVPKAFGAYHLKSEWADELRSALNTKFVPTIEGKREFLKNIEDTITLNGVNAKSVLKQYDEIIEDPMKQEELRNSYNQNNHVRVLDEEEDEEEGDEDEDEDEDETQKFNG